MTARAIVAGDATEPAISAASILAKTARDNYMNQMDTVYPAYSFRNSQGLRHAGSPAAAGTARSLSLAPALVRAAAFDARGESLEAVRSPAIAHRIFLGRWDRARARTDGRGVGGGHAGGGADRSKQFVCDGEVLQGGTECRRQARHRGGRVDSRSGRARAVPDRVPVPESGRVPAPDAARDPLLPRGAAARRPHAGAQLAAEATCCAG